MGGSDPLTRPVFGSPDILDCSLNVSGVSVLANMNFARTKNTWNMNQARHELGVLASVYLFIGLINIEK